MYKTAAYNTKGDMRKVTH